MDFPTPETNLPTDPAQEEKMLELLHAQLALGDSIASTSQFLRFVLSLANENLSAIRTQLETIRDLAVELDSQEKPQ